MLCASGEDTIFPTNKPIENPDAVMRELSKSGDLGAAVRCRLEMKEVS